MSASDLRVKAWILESGRTEVGLRFNQLIPSIDVKRLSNRVCERGRVAQTWADP